MTHRDLRKGLKPLARVGPRHSTLNVDAQICKPQFDSQTHQWWNAYYEVCLEAVAGEADNNEGR